MMGIGIIRKSELEFIESGNEEYGPLFISQIENCPIFIHGDERETTTFYSINQKGQFLVPDQICFSQEALPDLILSLCKRLHGEQWMRVVEKLNQGG